MSPPNPTPGKPLAVDARPNALPQETVDTLTAHQAMDLIFDIVTTNWVSKPIPRRSVLLALNIDTGIFDEAVRIWCDCGVMLDTCVDGERYITYTGPPIESEL